METDIHLKVKSKFIGKFKEGYPLIFKEAIINMTDVTEEGSIVKLVDEENKFIGKGYYGKQNKGDGWILSRKENEQIDQNFFEKKINAALNNRKHFYNNPETTAFRVFNGEGDGIGGLTIDFFAGYYLINWYSKGIYEFKDHVFQSLKRSVEYKAIYQKKRFNTDGKYIEEDGFVLGERGEFPIIVKENGVNLPVYLNEGAMVGVFLDQRDVRRTIKERYSAGKTILNVFSYTGAFSVFASLGGATKTTNVDLAKRSLSKTIEMFNVNGVDEDAQDIIIEDAFHYYKYAARKQLKFDVVILDPPSFARSKKVTFSAAKDYTDLLKKTIAITEDNGIIVASTNSSAFNMRKFKVFIEAAFREMDMTYQLLETFSLPEDFRVIEEFKEGSYLKVAFIKKING